MPLSPFFLAYLVLWSAAGLVALYLMVRRRHRLSLFGTGYRACLLTPWKVVTFAVAAMGLVVIAPISGDPTWDYFDAAMMSVLTYLTAPWAVGTLYRARRGLSDGAEIYVAVCLWMFSASWCYDLYILVRDGVYPGTWSANIAASSVLYVCAGLMWNLEWRDGRGVIFGFMAGDWPCAAEPGGARRIAIYAVPFAALVAAMIVPFVLDFMGWW